MSHISAKKYKIQIKIISQIKKKEGLFKITFVLVFIGLILYSIYFLTGLINNMIIGFQKESIEKEYQNYIWSLKTSDLKKSNNTIPQDENKNFNHDKEIHNKKFHNKEKHVAHNIDTINNESEDYTSSIIYNI